ncbi:MAG: DUF2721 domain-containing protein [Deltaproteobacteria bacterium]|nr:DUF2721 domain-containing protein [Deltaproteobacteria bacterium]
MPATSLSQVIPVLQLAIGPVILISGMGLLLLTMTNRLGRAIDRSRILFKELRLLSGSERERVLAQVQILFRRARLIRLAITLAAASAILAGLLVISLFVVALLQLELGLLISLLFIGCMAALVAFMQDIHLSLVALRLELGHAASAE